MLSIKALLLSTLLSQTVGSFSDGPIAYKDVAYTVTVGGSAFTTLAINSSKTMDALKVKGYRYLMIGLQYTFAAATAVTMTCQDSEDASVWRDIHALQFNPYPTAMSAPQIWSYAAGSSKNWVWSVGVRGVYMRCTFIGTGASGGDTLTVTARPGF